MRSDVPFYALIAPKVPLLPLTESANALSGR